MRWAATLSTLAACSFDHAAPIAVSSDSKLDDVAPVPDAPSGTWSTPVEISELNSGFGDDDPSLTADLLEIFWGSRRTANVGEDIWMARRSSVSSPWTMVQAVSSLNTNDTETTGKVTSDGMAIFFTRDVGGNPDIFAAARSNPTSTTWQSVARVDALSSASPDYGPAVRNDLQRVVLCRGSTVANEALYLATRGGMFDAWSGASVIAELDEAGISECDAMEPRDNVMYFASNRSPDGRYHIYRTERAQADQPWGPIVAVSAVNLDGFNDRDPWVSADERYMVFSSDRLGGSVRLFVTTR